MASVEKWRDGWRVRWRERVGRGVDGEPMYRARSRVCPDKRTADQVAREVEQAHALGQAWVPPDELAEADLRIGYQDWLAHLVRAGRKPSTIEATAPALSALWAVLRATPGRAVPASLLTREALEQVFDHVKASGASDFTAARRVQTVEAWWRWMYDRELAGVGRPKTIAVTAVDAPPALEAPTWEEMDAVIADLASAGWGPAARAAAIMRCTGLRVSQVLALRWSDFRASSAELVVRPELAGSKSRAERAGRIVPVSPVLLALVDRWQERGGEVVGLKRHAVAHSLRQAWARAEASGVVRREVWKPEHHRKGRPDHAFRAGFVSGLKRAGADNEAVEVLVGHHLGLRGQYVARDSLPLRAAVQLVPGLTPPKVLRVAGRLGARADG